VKRDGELTGCLVLFVVMSHGAAQAVCRGVKEWEVAEAVMPPACVMLECSANNMNACTPKADR